MWWQFLCGALALALGGGLCAASVHDGYEHRSAIPGSITGILVLLIAAVCFFSAGGARYQISWGCPSVDAMSGLESNTPYQTLSSVTIDGRVYDLVRLVDQADKQPVRCVLTDAELPPVFSVGSQGIIMLSAARLK